MPKFTEKELIPEIFLKTICCSCETGYNSLKCDCRKHGLKSTNLFSNCHGSEKCFNVEENTYELIQQHFKMCYYCIQLFNSRIFDLRENLTCGDLFGLFLTYFRILPIIRLLRLGFNIINAILYTLA
ncbi:unnamed protein product [Psylliodes chrysocephalus]|uniref:Uncharacterized protein n=1 Tax=Psylliodes chrysocephalus TaxID=3402493 RepID=A0A9P0CXU8_9CUCU|nr:unnamed protein product [Psylliodes chrysocephala]